MFTKLVVVATLASLTLAAQLGDVVIPESSAQALSLRDMPASSLSKTPRQTALETYKFLQQSGNDDSACRILAQDMIQEAQDAVQTATDNMKAVDLGDSCPTTNQEEVTNAENALDEAKKETKRLQDAMSEVENLQVTMTVDYIPDPAVTHFTSTPEWQEAKNKYEGAKSKLDARPPIEEALQNALHAERHTQETEQEKCYCTAQTTYNNAAAINDDPEAAKKRNNDYAKAQELLCILDDKSPCNYDPLATVTVPTLPEATANAQCATTTV